MSRLIASVVKRPSIPPKGSAEESDISGRLVVVGCHRFVLGLEGVEPVSSSLAALGVGCSGWQSSYLDLG
jgi:hypothetical protein